MQTSDRLYYSDSFLAEFPATVSGVRGPVEKEPLWRVSLSHSAFYPTSGGQPFDTGVLRTAAASEIKVEQVEEDEDGTVWHFVTEPVAVGTEVAGRIDWERRFDHMQQHTGQHLLSAVFFHELNALTVSFHLGAEVCTIDLATGPLGEDALERIEQISNRMIAEDRPVTTSYVSRQEAEQMLGSGDLRKLPERDGTIRLVTIAGLDRNACGGTHVRSTGQIGGLLVRGVEKVSRGVRVEFVCGLRAVRTARLDAAILREAGALLSTGTPEIPSAIGRVQAEGKSLARERLKLREELAVLQGAGIAGEVPVEGGLRFVVRGFKDRDRDYVKLLAARTAAAATATAVLFSAEDADPVRVFVARSKDLAFDCGRTMREALAQIGLRGGGSPDLAQGDVPAEKVSAFREAVEGAIRHAVGATQE